MKSESGFSFAIASQPLLQRFTNNSDKWINFELLSGSELCWSKVSVSKRLFSRAGLILDWSSLLAALDASLSLLLSSPGRRRPTIPSRAYHQITLDPHLLEKNIRFESWKTWNFLVVASSEWQPPPPPIFSSGRRPTTYSVAAFSNNKLCIFPILVSQNIFLSFWLWDALFMA